MTQKTQNIVDHATNYITKTREGREFYLRYFLHGASQGLPVNPAMLRWISRGLSDCLDEGATFKKAFGLEKGKGRKKTRQFEDKRLGVAADVQASLDATGCSKSQAYQEVGRTWNMTANSVKKIYLKIRKTDERKINELIESSKNQKAP